MPQIYRPESLALRETVRDGRAEIHVSPSRLVAIPLLLFALVWDSFMCAFVIGSAGLGLIFGSLHIAAGVAITYAALFRLLVVPRLGLSAEGFVLEYARFPRKGVEEPIYNVEGFDVAQVAVGWLSAARFGSRGEKTPWQLRLLTRAGVARRLPIAIDDVEHLRYIADRLNATLAEMRVPIGYRDERMAPPGA